MKRQFEFSAKGCGEVFCESFTDTVIDHFMCGEKCREHA